MDKIVVVLGDIAEQDCDVIVNAANEDLLPGCGVSGAVHASAGPGLAHECAQIGGCSAGEAVITESYDLPCKSVIHTVGPVWGGGENDEESDILASCYRESIRLAADHGYRSLAIPAISTGTYGFPYDEAANVAILAVVAALEEYPEIEEVRLVCMLPECLDAIEASLQVRSDAASSPGSES